MLLQELFCEFVKEHEIPYGEIKLEPEAPNQILIYMNGENGNFEGHGMFFEEEGLFVFYTLVGVCIPENKRQAMCRWLMNLNYRLKSTAFYIEESTGELTVRVSHYMVGSDWEKRQLMARLVTESGKTADWYYPEIMKELFGQPN